jgi:hypothetical protein
MELEKKASDKEYLNTIAKSDVSKMIQLISDKRKEKESSMSSSTMTEKKPKKGTKSASADSVTPTKKKTSKKVKSDESITESGLETVSSVDM